MSLSRRSWIAATLSALAAAPIVLTGRMARAERPLLPTRAPRQPEPPAAECRKKPIWIGHC